jgi:hypothetical protein
LAGVIVASVSLVSFQAVTHINAYGNPEPNRLCLI